MAGGSAASTDDVVVPAVDVAMPAVEAVDPSPIDVADVVVHAVVAVPAAVDDGQPVQASRSRSVESWRAELRSTRPLRTWIHGVNPISLNEAGKWGSDGLSRLKS